jgi:hypothetical protein
MTADVELVVSVMATPVVTSVGFDEVALPEPSELMAPGFCALASATMRLRTAKTEEKRRILISKERGIDWER